MPKKKLSKKDLELIAALPKSAWRTIAEGEGQRFEQAQLSDNLFAVRQLPGTVVLIFTKAELRAFIQGAKAGEFDDLV